MSESGPSSLHEARFRFLIKLLPLFVVPTALLGLGGGYLNYSFEIAQGASLVLYLTLGLLFAAVAVGILFVPWSAALLSLFGFFNTILVALLFSNIYSVPAYMLFHMEENLGAFFGFNVCFLVCISVGLVMRHVVDSYHEPRVR